MNETRKDFAQATLHTVQALAMLSAGCWVAFRYFSHERESDRLARAQQVHTNEQLVRLAATQRSSEEAKLRQLELANKQAALAVGIQRDQQSLSLALQKLGVEQAELGLRMAQSQERLRAKELALSVQLQDLESKKREQDLAFSGSYRFEPIHELTCKKRRELPNGFAEYELTYWLKFTNRSNTPFDVSFYVIDLYLGSPRGQIEGPTVRRLNIPNLRNFTMLPAADDAFVWQHVSAIGGILQRESSHHGEVRRPEWSYTPPIDLKLNVLGLGQIKNGESTSRSEIYFITAPSTYYVTAYLAYCFNSCLRREDGFTGSNVVALADAAPLDKGADDAP